MSRDWEIIIYPLWPLDFWRFCWNKPRGKNIPFLHETQVSPVKYRKWADPRSISSVSRWLIWAKDRTL